MSRNRPPDSGRRAPPASARKIDLPVLVISTLTLFFATLFAALLLLRPESSGPSNPMPLAARSEQAAPPVDAPPVDLFRGNFLPVDAPPGDLANHDTPPVDAPPGDLPRVDASPPEWNLSAEPKPDPMVNPALRAQLEQLGVKCAEGANCYSD